MPTVACKICSTDFYAKPFWIIKGYGKYCSSKCQHQGRRAGEDKPCHICGKISYKKKRQLDNSETGFFFCGKSCQTKWRNSFFVGSKHANWKDGNASYRSVMLKHDIPQICRLCKTEDLRILAVHHIDRDRKNSSLSNLAWLCHNCHFLLHHYKDVEEKFMEALV